MILPDYLRPGLRIVFCGTAAGTASARRGHYYAGPGNRFWPMLHETGLTPRWLRPDEDHLLPDFGHGLTDLAKTAFGPDARIPAQSYDPVSLFEKINNVQPAVLAFTSLTAARLALNRPEAAAGDQADDPRLPGIRLFALPSPSALAKSHFSAAPWHSLAEETRG